MEYLSNILKGSVLSDFLSENIFCPLNKENVMLAVIGIIYESIPDLVALDLSNNKLSSLNCMKSMVEKVASLKILHIGQNKVSNHNRTLYIAV